MKFNVEIPIPAHRELTEDALLALSGHQVEIGCDGTFAVFYGERLSGRVVGASKSPRDRVLRLVVDTADSDQD